MAAIGSVHAYEMWSPVGAPIDAEMYKSFAKFGSLPSESPAMLQDTGGRSGQTEKVREELGGVGPIEDPVEYPKGEFAHKLAGLANYLDRGLPVRVVTINAAGGFDTHTDEAEDLDKYLAETCAGVAAFQRDLEARGINDRVMIEMWSEFGRRPEENGSGGTDHERRAAPWSSLQIGGQNGRRIPRPDQPRRERKPPRHQRFPATTPAACWSSGWASTRPR